MNDKKYTEVLFIVKDSEDYAKRLSEIAKDITDLSKESQEIIENMEWLPQAEAKKMTPEQRTKAREAVLAAHHKIKTLMKGYKNEL